MNWFSRTFSYSVGRKFIMALTGLFLVLYLVEHLIGNLLILWPDQGGIYSAYAEFLVHNVFIRSVEIFLFAAFIFHIIDAYVLFGRNRKSRGSIRYAVNKPAPRTRLSSRTMIITGSIIFIFLVIHLNQFFIPSRFTHSFHPANPERELYEMALATFSNPVYVILYVIAMIMVGFHIDHGFKSAFQTIGARHPKYYPAVRGIGIFLSWAFAVGFSIIPLSILFGLVK